MKQVRMVIGTSLVMVVVMACIVCTTTAQPAAKPARGTRYVTKTPGGAVISTARQVGAGLEAMQQDLRKKRLAILKKVEAGEMKAEQALDALDRLPLPPSHFQRPGERLLWLKAHVSDGQNEEVDFAVPLSLIRWVLVEGPRLVPAPIVEEIKKEGMGMDISALNLSGLALALDSLSQIREKTTLLRIQDGDQIVEVTIEPELTEGRTEFTRSTRGVRGGGGTVGPRRAPGRR